MQTSTLAPELLRRIEEQRKEAEELRRVHGDPVEFMKRVMRETWTKEELNAAFLESIGELPPDDDERHGR